MSFTSNNVTWFEIGTDDVATARDFYGAVFGWTFETGPGASSYSMISTPGGEGALQGGLADTGGRAPNYAVFYIQVDDVPATLAAAEARSAKVGRARADHSGRPGVRPGARSCRQPDRHLHPARPRCAAVARQRALSRPGSASSGRTGRRPGRRGRSAGEATVPR